LDYSFSVWGPNEDDFGNSMESAGECKINEPIPDDYGNFKDNSQKIQLSSKVEGLSNYIGDADCFSFECIEEGIYKLDFKSYSDFNYNIKLTEVLKIADTKANAISVYYTESAVYFRLDKDITYYFTISNNYDYCYLFNYPFIINGPLQDDHESTIESAHEIMLNNNVSSEIVHMNDYDYFKFSPSITGTYYLDNLSISKLDIRERLQIMNSTGNFIYPQIEITDNTQPFINLIKDETYYIYFTNSISHDIFTYSFNLKGPIRQMKHIMYVQAAPALP